MLTARELNDLAKQIYRVKMQADTPLEYNALSAAVEAVVQIGKRIESAETND